MEQTEAILIIKMSEDTPQRARNVEKTSHQRWSDFL